jgi:uroporphyrinogen decarboxylase
VSAILPDIARTGLSILCPLERAPGGDVDLAEVKRLYGDRLCLKGNVETSLLLSGTPEQVAAQVRECIRAAGGDGGYILGTGDQVARDTPFENIHALVEAGLTYGRYG